MEPDKKRVLAAPWQPKVSIFGVERKSLKQYQMSLINFLISFAIRKALKLFSKFRTFIARKRVNHTDIWKLYLIISKVNIYVAANAFWP